MPPSVLFTPATTPVEPVAPWPPRPVRAPCPRPASTSTSRSRRGSPRARSSCPSRPAVEDRDARAREAVTPGLSAAISGSFHLVICADEDARPGWRRVSFRLVTPLHVVDDRDAAGGDRQGDRGAAAGGVGRRLLVRRHRDVGAGERRLAGGELLDAGRRAGAGVGDLDVRVDPGWYFDAHCCSIVCWNVEPCGSASAAAAAAALPPVPPLLLLPQAASPSAATAAMPAVRITSETFTTTNLR